MNRLILHQSAASLTIQKDQTQKNPKKSPNATDTHANLLTWKKQLSKKSLLVQLFLPLGSFQVIFANTELSALPDPFLYAIKQSSLIEMTIIMPYIIPAAFLTPKLPQIKF